MVLAREKLGRPTWSTGSALLVVRPQDLTRSQNRTDLASYTISHSGEPGSNIDRL